MIKVSGVNYHDVDYKVRYSQGEGQPRAELTIKITAPKTLDDFRNHVKSAGADELRQVHADWWAGHKLSEGAKVRPARAGEPKLAGKLLSEFAPTKLIAFYNAASMLGKAPKAIGAWLVAQGKATTNPDGTLTAR